MWYGKVPTPQISRVKFWKGKVLKGKFWKGKVPEAQSLGIQKVQSWKIGVVWLTYTCTCKIALEVLRFYSFKILGLVDTSDDLNFKDFYVVPIFCKYCLNNCKVWSKDSNNTNFCMNILTIQCIFRILLWLTSCSSELDIYLSSLFGIPWSWLEQQRFRTWL